jgi:putative transposase
MSFKLSDHAAYNLNYHFVWCPKYRRKVLTDDISKRLETLIRQKASKIEVTIEAIEIMPDHVHLFVSATPLLSPHHIAAQFKGFTSHELRKEFPELRTKLPTLWSRSYYVGACGHASESVVKMYIENQKGK